MMDNVLGGEMTPGQHREPTSVNSHHPTSPPPSSPSPSLSSGTGDTLRRMSKRNRATFLKAIVKQLDSSDAHYLMELVRRKLKVDPLGELPVELQFRVLLLIGVANPLTLLHMARVCRSWRGTILDSPRTSRWLWRRTLQRTMLSVPAQSLLAGPGSRTVALSLAALRLETQLANNWQRATCRRETLAAHGASVITCLHLDEIAGVLISGSDNGSVGLWSLRTGENIRALTGHQGGVWALAARYPILVTGSTDRTLIVWDLTSGARLADLVGHSSTVRCVLIIGDEGQPTGTHVRAVVSGSRDGTVRVWDIRTGNCQHILTGHTASVRCLAPWGTEHVVSGSYDGTLRVWNVRTGQCTAVCAGHDGKVYSVATSSEYIFSGGMDAKIRVWRPTDGELVDVFSEHSALVGLLEIRDARHLVAGSTDGSLSLWDIRRLRRIRHLELAHRASITALDCNRHAIISGSERSLQLWSLPDLLRIDEPAESISLSDKMDVVWRVTMGEVYGAIAYQQAGVTRLDILNFHP